MKLHYSYRFEGVVQGVGFRPFIYTLALRYHLLGYVLNDSSGVEVSVEGFKSELEGFEIALQKELPPLARIDKIQKEQKKLQHFATFIIKESQHKDAKYSLVSPDFSMCDDCYAQMQKSDDKRYNYFFINCTNCGPRYSIIKTIPYDRPNTSMATFEMCESCKKEYENPLDRRYHAQPISCPQCGPSLKLKTIFGDEIASNHKAIKELASKIKAGQIVAMKGMGGFHLICDASCDEVVKTLRSRKKRPTKPFAVMFKDIEHIKKASIASNSELKAISSQDRPIVLVKKNPTYLHVSQFVAPNIDRLGVFLPYTPLHVLLLNELSNPIIATSANISGEPIITDAKDLEQKLGDVIDFYLDYNREIINASDDSVIQVIGDKRLTMRASRGITPISVSLSSDIEQKVLAVGAHQKNSIAFYMNSQMILSPFIGDLDNVASVDFFKRTLNTFEHFYDFKADQVVCDKHPLYESTKWAKAQNLPTTQVQHHYAHILACMFEHNIDEKVLGVAWDGTGYGDDGSIWGGEFLICDRHEYERVAYFEPFLLLGGEASIKDIKRVALSMIFDCEKHLIFDEFYGRFSKSEMSILKQMHEKKLNAPRCSAVGRIFDAVAAICGICEKVSYDGESGLIIESLYDDSINEAYDIYLDGNIIRYKHTLCDMLKDGDPRVIASKFINALCDIIVQISNKYTFKTLLAGGVFQNRTLMERLLDKKSNLIFPHKLPINDGSVAVGQLTYFLSNK